MIINACIFDLDGVIVDTAKYHFKAWRKMANDLGFDFTEEQNEKLKGISRMDSLKLILEWGNVKKNKKEREALAEQKNEHYLSLISKMDESEILDGIIPFLNHLRQQKKAIVLGSSSKNAERILRNVNLIDYFDAIVDGRHVENSKPDPEVFLRGADAVNVPHNEIVVFEDAAKGVQAALAGGFYAVGIGEEANLTQAHFVLPNLVGQTLPSISKRLKNL